MEYRRFDDKIVARIDRGEEILEQVKELARSNEIMEKQYDAGLSSVMDLLDVRRQLLAARQEQAEARRRQLAAVVGLCKALGGGWTEAKGFE